MTFINKIIRVIPKKQVNLEDLDRKSAIAAKVEPAQTIKKNAVNPAKASANPSDNEEEDAKMVNGEYEIVEREIMPEKIICPDCGGLTLEGLEFCDKCGGDLTNL